MKKRNAAKEWSEWVRAETERIDKKMVDSKGKVKFSESEIAKYDETLRRLAPKDMSAKDSTVLVILNCG